MSSYQNPPHGRPRDGHPLADIVAEYNRRTPTSKRLAAEGRPVMADKSSIGLAFSRDLKEACYPVVVQRAEGAYLWDADGNRYTDILNGLGTCLFGHNPAFIRAAIQQTLDQGFPIGPQSALAGETAALFCRLTGMDRVTFSNTGTEAVMAAIRIARTASGRRHIAVFTNAYHGHCDTVLVRASRLEYARRRALEISADRPWLAPLRPLLANALFTGAHPAAAGIPAAACRDVMVLEYGNPRSLAKIKAARRRLAAVVVEPVQSRCPELQPAAFLRELRDLTAAAGIALIFDEMITGFRVHPGGAQAHFGIEADLATYSKIAGGGLPLSIIAGRNGYMDYIDGGTWQFGDDSAPRVATTFFAGTFCRHPLALAAARATADYLLAQGPGLQVDLNQKTAALIARLNDFTTAAGIPVRFVRFGSFFSIDMSRSAIDRAALRALSFLLLNQGIHLRAGDKGGFLSTAHSAADIDAIYTAFTRGLEELSARALIRTGTTTTDRRAEDNHHDNRD